VITYLNHIKKDIKAFIRYLRANEVGSVYPVTESTILKYRQFLWDEFVEAKGSALSIKSQTRRLRNVVRLFRYLCKEGILKGNPAQNLGWEQYYKEIAQKAKTLPERQPDNNLTELDQLTVKFLEYEGAIGKDATTIKTYKKGVEVFYKFLDEKGIENIAQVNKRLLLEYYMYLCNYTGVRRDAVGNGYKNHLLWSIKLFFRFLVRFDYLPKDPTLDLESIKEDRGLPRTCMNEKEVVQLLEQPQLNHNPLMARDKAMLELLFSTGIRSNELCSLKTEDVDHLQEMVRINDPKGGANHQRIIPIGKVALQYLSVYLKDARPQLENGDPKTLFLSYTGHRLRNDSVLLMVKKYAHQCGFRKNITTHSLRVTCATLMLKNGADIRYVQEQLGHKKITSTQVYTRLMPLDLKSIHQRCHPREKKSAVLCEN
jgi:integrase/recombinase XerD